MTEIHVGFSNVKSEMLVHANITSMEATQAEILFMPQTIIYADKLFFARCQLYRLLWP